jgi:hypothetical protein
LGYLDATTAPIRRRGAGSFAARRAKELGADAIVVMQQGQEYAGASATAAPSPLEISTTTASPRPLPERDSPPRCFSGKLKYSRSSGNKRSFLRSLRNSKDSNHRPSRRNLELNSLTCSILRLHLQYRVSAARCESTVGSIRRNHSRRGGASLPMGSSRLPSGVGALCGVLNASRSGPV